MSKCIIFVTILLFTFNAFSNPYCGEILRYGIHDELSNSSDYADFKKAKRVHCSKEVSSSKKDSDTSGDVGFKAFTLDASNYKSSTHSLSEEFCKMTYNEFSSKGKHRNAVRLINNGILNAWKSCLNSEVNQVVHWITPTSDPKQFTYKIKYIKDCNPHYNPTGIKLSKFKITGATCDEALPEGFSITTSGKTLTCTRKSKKDAVIITADVEKHGDHIRAIELPAYKNKAVLIKSKYPATGLIEDFRLNYQLNIAYVDGLDEGTQNPNRLKVRLSNAENGVVGNWTKFRKSGSPFSYYNDELGKTSHRKFTINGITHALYIEELTPNEVHFRVLELE